MWSARAAGRWLVEDDSEVQLAALFVHVGDLDADSIAEAELSAAGTADEAEAVGVVVEVIVFRDRADVNEAIDRHFESLAEHSEAFDTGDNRIEFLTHFARHERKQLELCQLAFGLSRSAFGVRAVRAEDFEFRFAHAAS